MHPPLLPCFALATLAAATALPAQQVGGEWSQIHDGFGEANSFYGNAVAGLGDVDGDGFGDYAVGAMWNNGLKGTVFVYSGLSHLEIRRHDGSVAGDAFGSSVCGLGDLDGDGLGEILVGAHKTAVAGQTWAGRAAVFRGSDGALLYDYPGTTTMLMRGHSCASAGDVNLDGIPDFMFSEPTSEQFGGGTTGEVFLMDGASGALIRSHVGVAIEDHFGQGLAGPGDLNGDGYDDVVITASTPATVTAFSGFDGAQIWHQVYPGVDLHLEGMGDLNDDSIPDLVVGGWKASPGGVSGSGSVYLLSGADGSVLLQIDGTQANERLGYDVAPVRDLDGDGITDFLAGQPGQILPDFTNFVRAYSSASGELLHQIAGFSSDDRLGQAIDNAGDMDHDGLEDLLFGAQQAAFSGTMWGRIDLWNFDPYLRADAAGFSAGGGGTLTYQFDFPDDAAGDSYHTLVSARGRGPVLFPNGVLVPLGFDLWLAQTYLGQYPPVFRDPVGVLDVDGKGVVQLVVPANAAAALVGQLFHLAVVCKPGAESWRYSTISVPVEVLP